MFKINTAVAGLWLGSFINTTTGAEQAAGTVTAKKTIDGTGSVCGNTPTYDATALGWKVNLSAGDLNGTVCGFRFTCSGCQPINLTIKTDKPVGDLNDLAITSVATPAMVTSLSGTYAKDATVAKLTTISTLSGAMAKDATVAKEATFTANTITLAAAYDPAKTAASATNLAILSGRLETKIPTNFSFTGANVNADSKVTAVPTGMALEASIHTLSSGIGVGGVALTALGDTRIANLDATVSSRASATALSTLSGAMGKDATVAKEATLTGRITTLSGALNTKIPTNFSFTGANVDAESKVTAAPTGMATMTGIATLSGSLNRESLHLFGGLVSASGSATTFNVTGFPTGADWTKALIKVRDVTAGGYAQLRRIYSMNAGTGDVTVEPDLGFIANTNDQVDIYHPALLKTDFFSDGNSIHTTAGGAAYAVDAAGAAIATLASIGVMSGAIGSAVSTVLGVVNGLQILPKNTACSNFPVKMVLAGTETPATGKTVLGYISKDGGAWAALTNSVSEVGSGLYKVDIIAAELNADVVVLRFEEGTCDQKMIGIKTQA